MKLFINYSNSSVVLPVKTSEDETKVQVIPKNGIPTNLYHTDEKAIARSVVDSNITILDCDNFGIIPMGYVGSTFDLEMEEREVDSLPTYLKRR